MKRMWIDLLRRHVHKVRTTTLVTENTFSHAPIGLAVPKSTTRYRYLAQANKIQIWMPKVLMKTTETFWDRQEWLEGERRAHRKSGIVIERACG